MGKSIKEIAAEILAVETQGRTGEMSPEQKARWRELVIELLAQLQPTPDKRQSHRLPVNAANEATLKKQERLIKCELNNISISGLSVQGDLTPISEGDAVQLIQLHLDDNLYELELQCDVIWKKQVENTDRQLAGIDIHSGNSFQQMEKFFKEVYYSIYMNYLLELST